MLYLKGPPTSEYLIFPIIFAHQGHAKIKGDKLAHQGAQKLEGRERFFWVHKNINSVTESFAKALIVKREKTI